MGDWISLLGRADEVEQLKREFAAESSQRSFVVIAGGGETGYHLAKALDAQRHKVLLLEDDADRCDYLASHLSRATVVCADATRKVTLEEERVGGCDYFVACTGNDENNIMSGVEAKSLGAGHVMSIVGRPDYAEIVGKLGIDVAVSERDAMARQILGLMTEGSVLSRMQMPESDIFVLEMEVGSEAAVANKPLIEVELPEGVLIAAVLQEDYVKVPGASDALMPGNTALVLCPQSQVDKLTEIFNEA
jgi:trk system potassium uptake protein TrkA